VDRGELRASILRSFLRCGITSFCVGEGTPLFRCARLSDALGFPMRSADGHSSLATLGSQRTQLCSLRFLAATNIIPPNSIKLNSIPSAQAEYDHEFVKELKTFIYQMISRSNKGVTLNALTKLIITDNKITHVELTKREVLMVVDTAQGGWGMGRLVRVQRGGERG